METLGGEERKGGNMDRFVVHEFSLNVSKV